MLRHVIAVVDIDRSRLLSYAHLSFTDNSKQKIITQAGYSFAQSLGELAILGCSPMMLQFVARTVASQANLYARASMMPTTTIGISLAHSLTRSLARFASIGIDMAKDPNVQDLHIFAQRFSKDVFVILERMLALARKQDIEAARTIMRFEFSLSLSLSLSRSLALVLVSDQTMQHTEPYRSSRKARHSESLSRILAC